MKEKMIFAGKTALGLVAVLCVVLALDSALHFLPDRIGRIMGVTIGAVFSIATVLGFAIFVAVSVPRKRGTLAESSVGLDMEHVEPLLHRIAKLVPSGFGDQEVAKVVSTTKTLKHDEEKDLRFAVNFGGKLAELRVKVFMDDIDSPDIYFFSPPDLAKQIDKEIQTFMKEQGI